MRKIKILKVSFDSTLTKHDIPAFRGEHLLFHNHINDKQVLYKYPLIQYKRLSGKPMIMCIDVGVDEIHKYFQKDSWDLKISNRWLNMHIDQLNMNQFTMQVWEKQWTHSIYDWLALNQTNYQKYQGMEALSERLDFLEHILKANILSFAKGIGWNVDKPIKLSITSLRPPKPLSLKGNKVIGFDLDFTCNVFIPNYIGLGKSVSLGFGMVKEMKQNKPTDTKIEQYGKNNF